MRQLLQENWQQVRAEIADACRAAGREPSEVTLVAVTKTAPIEAVRILGELGQHDVAENRPQELWRKAAALADLPFRWHMIGRFQSNKIRRTLPLLSLLHSADRWDLLAEVAAESARLGKHLPCTLQVNVEAEPQKAGFAVAEVADILQRSAELPSIQVVGLMAMARDVDDPEAWLATFTALRRLRDDLGGSARLPMLSMGMSGDFRQAILAGATHVRIGSRLFAGLEEAN